MIGAVGHELPTGTSIRVRLLSAAARRCHVNVSAQGYATQQKNVTPPAADVAVVLKTAGRFAAGRGRGYEEAHHRFHAGARGRAAAPMQNHDRRGGGGDQSFNPTMGASS